MNQPQQTLPLTQDQQKKFTDFQTRVKNEVHNLVKPELTQKYSDEQHLKRLLIAREWNVNDAYEQWKRWIEWRKQYRADDIKLEEIQSEIDLRKAYWNGTDKSGNPCLVIKARRHFPGSCNQDTLIRFFLYVLDEGIQKAEKAGTGKISVIWDREGVTTKNFDSSMFGVVKKMLTLVQDNYAERLHQAFILFPNFLVKSVMFTVRPFLSEKTKQKLILCNEFKDLIPYFGQDFKISDGMVEEIQQEQESEEEQKKKVEEMLQNMKE